MKKLILLLLVLIGLAAEAQTYIPDNNYRQWLGAKPTKELYFPNRDTAWHPTGAATTYWSGHGFYRYNPDAGKWEDMAAQVKLDYITPEMFGAIGDGVTNDIIAFQAAIDTAAKYHKQVWGLPGKTYAINSALKIPSFSYINMTNASVYLISGSNSRMVENKHLATITSPTIVDSFITIKGGNWYGNGDNQSKFQPDGSVNTGFLFSGVKYLRLYEGNVFNTQTYAYWISNVQDVRVENFTIDQGILPATVHNQDGVHINGPAKNIWVVNGKIRSFDDPVAINANDVAQGPYSVNGEINGVYILNNRLDSCLNGIRVLSGSNKIDDVTIDGLSGQVMDYGISIGALGFGNGAAKKIFINNIQLNGITDPFESPTYIVVNDSLETLRVTNIQRSNTTEARPTILFYGGARVTNFEADKISVRQRKANYPFTDITINSGAVIDNFSISNHIIYNGSILAGNGININGATIRNASFNNIQYDSISTPIYISNSRIHRMYVNGLQIQQATNPIYFDNSTVVDSLQLANISRYAINGDTYRLNNTSVVKNKFAAIYFNDKSSGQYPNIDYDVVRNVDSYSNSIPVFNRINVGNAVVGSAPYAVNVINSSANSEVQVGQDNTYRGSFGWYYNSTGTDAYMGMNTNAGNPINFQENNSKTGKVGIGRQDPQYKLDVIDSANAIAARFGGRVIGAGAQLDNEIPTWGQTLKNSSATAGAGISVSGGVITNTRTNTSQLVNDAGFVTPSSTATFTNKSGNVSQWTNDAGYITGSYTGFDSRYQPLENQRLGTSNSPAWQNTTARSNMLANSLLSPIGGLFGFNSNAVVLSANRNENTGAIYNSGLTHTAIELLPNNGSSLINFRTGVANDAQAPVSMYLDGSAVLSVAGKVITPALQLTGGVPGTGKVLTSDASGNASWQNLPTIVSNSYTPTLTNQTNISASALQEALYTRVGNVVHVAMSVNITPTAPGTNTVLYFTLPISTSATSGSGVVTAGNLNLSGSAVRNNSTTGQIAFTSTTTSNQTYYMQYDYIVQ